MATVMKMIAGTSEGKKRNENERKHNGNSRKPADGQQPWPSAHAEQREEGGRGNETPDGERGPPTGPSTVRFVGAREQNQAAEHRHRQVDDDADRAPRARPTSLA